MRGGRAEAIRVHYCIVCVVWMLCSWRGRPWWNGWAWFGLSFCAGKTEAPSAEEKKGEMGSSKFSWRHLALRRSAFGSVSYPCDLLSSIVGIRESTWSSCSIGFPAQSASRRCLPQRRLFSMRQNKIPTTCFVVTKANAMMMITLVASHGILGICDHFIFSLYHWLRL